MTGSEHYFWGDKNIFRILADCTHLSSKVILIYTIHRLRSAEGISLLTQFLYLVVFLLRYLDLFWTFTYSKYNTSFKLFYIVSSVYTLFIMMKVFKRSREGEKEWRVAGWSLLGSFVVGVLGCLVFEEKKSFDLVSSCPLSPELVLMMDYHSFYGTSPSSSNPSTSSPKSLCSPTSPSAPP